VSYTLGQAARAVGRTKPTLAKAIKAGRLSAARADDGSYRIDPAELHRVYPVTGKPNGSMQRSDTPVVDGATPAILPAEVEGLRALLAERERLVEEQASAIRDLRNRLDSEVEERRRVQERLTLLLSPPVSAVSAAPDQRRPLGRRILDWLIKQHV
jgi:hypothetical protein